MTEAILVICAHNDDQVFGAGGTLAKYAEEGKEVSVIIFSYGEGSHPWLKRKVSVEMRVKESHNADSIIGITHTAYLGLEEGKFKAKAKEKKVMENIQNIIKEKKPVKIFTHSINDPHPDHQAVYSLVMDAINKNKIKPAVYSFDVWNPINIKKRDSPKLVVDITDTFKKKIEAIRSHKSQIPAIISLLWNVYAKAYINGINNDVKYAEVFYKIQ